MFLTLQEVKDYLRIDHGDEDFFLSLCLEAAEEYIRVYLKRDLTTWNVPKPVYIAALMMISEFYENRSVASHISAQSTIIRMMQPYRLYEVST
jgi:uncharacterized phage protein (predicted DNA packaging)